MQDTLRWVIWGLGILVTGLGGFLAGYLKKKGENLARKEDLDDLISEVHAVTTTTKKIEAEISTAVWDQQKRWEMKREVLFEAARRLGAVNDALISLNSAYQAFRQREQRGEPVSLDAKAQAGVKWMDDSSKFEETILLIAIVCGKELKDACDSFHMCFRQIAAGIFREDAEIYFKSAPEFVTKSNAVTTAIRKELETDKIA